MDENLGKAGGSACTVFPVDSFTKVEDTRPNNKPPAEVTNTMTSRIEGEGRNEVRVNAITDEATSGMGVNADHKKEGKVVSVPKSLEALIANLVVGSCVHENHDEQHEVASNTTRLGVMDHLGALLSDLCIYS